MGFLPRDCVTLSWTEHCIVWPRTVNVFSSTFEMTGFRRWTGIRYVSCRALHALWRTSRQSVRFIGPQQHRLLCYYEIPCQVTKVSGRVPLQILRFRILTVQHAFNLQGTQGLVDEKYPRSNAPVETVAGCSKSICGTVWYYYTYKSCGHKDCEFDRCFFCFVDLQLKRLRRRVCTDILVHNLPNITLRA